MLVLFSPVYFGVRRAHKGRLSSNGGPEHDGGGLPSRGAANGAWTGGAVLENLRKKLGASSRLEAVMVAMRLGILPSE